MFFKPAFAGVYGLENAQPVSYPLPGLKGKSRVSSLARRRHGVAKILQCVSRGPPAIFTFPSKLV
jgi:hypothetical protein